MKETVEQLGKIDIPDGCLFSGELVIEDESEGKLLLQGYFLRNDDYSPVEDVRMQLVDQDIAIAYAEAKAKEHYGIDFGSYKVVNVVPLK